MDGRVGAFGGKKKKKKRWIVHGASHLTFIFLNMAKTSSYGCEKL